MQLNLLAPLLALIATTNAVVVCTGFKHTPQGVVCDGGCTDHYISMNQEIDVPGTQCIYNSAKDTGFDLLVCNQEGLNGQCSHLSNLGLTLVDGNFNWYTPGTNSMLRIGK